MHLDIAGACDSPHAVDQQTHERVLGCEIIKVDIGLRSPTNIVAQLEVTLDEFERRMAEPADNLGTYREPGPSPRQSAAWIPSFRPVEDNQRCRLHEVVDILAVTDHLDAIAANEARHEPCQPACLQTLR